MLKDQLYSEQSFPKKKGCYVNVYFILKMTHILSSSSQTVIQSFTRSLWKAFSQMYTYTPVSLKLLFMCLNDDEKQRGPGSPFRLFLPPNILPLPLLEKGVPDKTRKNLFADNMVMLLTNLNIENLNKIDLVFIPIIHNEHVFVLVFDMKNSSFEVMDNKATGVIKLERYSHIPATMKDVFANYLLNKDHPNALKIYNLTPTLLDLPWKTTKNGVDCGVFSMRHMETYMGGGLKKWKTGLNPESEAQRRQLNQLRFKYLCKIHLSSINILKDDVLVQARDHDSLDQKKKQWPKTILNQINLGRRSTCKYICLFV
ncbi:hypothetical protein R6Q57_009967 [Mikania cordata]